MAIHRSLRLGAARRNTLAACLAAALATSGAGAAVSAHQSSAVRHATSDEMVFGVLPIVGSTGARASLPTPNHPLGNIPVTHCLDDDTEGSLRYAFSIAGDGDVIDLRGLDCSTITLVDGEIATAAANLVVQGPGQDQLTIDANYESRIFSSKYDFTVNDVTLAHGSVDGGGGGCVAVEGNFTLVRSSVTACSIGDGTNSTAYGGGVYVGGDLNMHSSEISGNSVLAIGHALGAGVFVNGVTTVGHSTIAGNGATSTTYETRGGGLFSKGNATLTDTRVIYNTANSVNGAAYGGGVCTDSGANITVFTSTISGNAATSEAAWSYGGGLHGGSIVQLSATTLRVNAAVSHCADCRSMGGGASAFGLITANYSTISENSVLSASGSAGRAFGGGLATSSAGYAGQIVIANSTISGNEVIGGANGGSGYGGGIAAIAGTPFIAVNTTIAFNTASDFGGGAIGSAVGTYVPALYSSIVANNQSSVGADDLSLGPSSPSFVVAGSNNLVMAAGNGVTLPAQTITADPQLLQLEDNGGPTATHALETDSPAIDQGINPFDRVYDQRFCPYQREVGDAPDIGAFELQTVSADPIFGDGFDGGLPFCQ